MSGYVYAISDGRGAVKIGYAADPIRRLSELSVGRADALRLLGMARGDKRHEAQCHHLLRAYRIKGEWFRHEGRVSLLVDMLPAPGISRPIAARKVARRFGRVQCEIGASAHDVLAAAKAYAAAVGIGMSTASWRVFGDTKKLAAIEAGGDLYTGRARDAMQWLSDNWPDGHDWPADITRPAPSKPERAA